MLLPGTFFAVHVIRNAVRHDPTPNGRREYVESRLARVEFDDQLLVNWGIDEFTRRNLQHFASDLGIVPIQPCGRTTITRSFEIGFKYGGFLAAFTDCDDIARAHNVRRDIHKAAIDMKMAMRHELTRLRTARRQAQAVHDVIETTLEQLQERDARLSGNASRGCKVIRKLRFMHTVVTTHLLLLAQLTTVLRKLRARLASRDLAGRSGAHLTLGARATTPRLHDVFLGLNRTLFGVAAITLKEEFDNFTSL